MKRYLFVLLTAVLVAGCTSVSAPYASPPSGGQEQKIQKLLVGTWKGYVKDSNWYRIGKDNRDKTLVISRVLKENDSWTVSLTVNRQSPEYATLYVYDRTIILEVMDRYGGLYVLEPYSNTHLLGRLGYDRGRWPTTTHNEVTLEKISY